MDNQGSNSFNNNQSATPRDANFWNPVPPQSQQSTQLTPSVQTPQSYVSTSTSSAPVSQNNNYNTQSYGQPSSTYQPYNSVATPQSSTIPQTSQSFTSANNTSFATQVTDPSGNLLSKDFNLMTDEEKKEAERIARAKNRIDLLKTIGLIVVSLLAVLFIGLFIWMTLKWSEANTNVQGKIDVAVVTNNNYKIQRVKKIFFISLILTKISLF